MVVWGRSRGSPGPPPRLPLLSSRLGGRRVEDALLAAGTDIGERENLVGSHPDVARRLRELLTEGG